MKRKRLLWGGGILAGMLVGVPLLLWGGYAVLALVRQEHFYHKMPASWWGHVTVWRGNHPDLAHRLSRSRIGRLTDYYGISAARGAPDMFDDPAFAPILCDFVRSGGRYRCIAIAYLCQLRLHPEVVVPELIAVLRRPHPLPNDPPRVDAIGDLRCFRREAVSAVPVLLDLVYQGTKEVQGAAWNALANIEPGNVDLFLGLLNHPDDEIAKAAIRILGNRGPNANKAKPRLLELITHPTNAQERRLRQVAVDAVFTIDREAADKAGVPKGHN